MCEWLWDRRSVQVAELVEVDTVSLPNLVVSRDVTGGRSWSGLQTSNRTSLASSTMWPYLPLWAKRGYPTQRLGANWPSGNESSLPSVNGAVGAKWNESHTTGGRRGRSVTHACWLGVCTSTLSWPFSFWCPYIIRLQLFSALRLFLFILIRLRDFALIMTWRQMIHVCATSDINQTWYSIWLFLWHFPM